MKSQSATFIVTGVGSASIVSDARIAAIETGLDNLDRQKFLSEIVRVLALFEMRLQDNRRTTKLFRCGGEMSRRNVPSLFRFFYYLLFMHSFICLEIFVSFIELSSMIKDPSQPDDPAVGISEVN